MSNVERRNVLGRKKTIESQVFGITDYVGDMSMCSNRRQVLLAQMLLIMMLTFFSFLCARLKFYMYSSLCCIAVHESS